MWNGLENLLILNLPSNKINSIPYECFELLTKLEQLDMSINDIIYITHYSWLGPASLKKLDLSFNDISNIAENTFSLMGNLEILELSWNNISVIISGSFQRLRSLQELYLSRNYISNMEQKSLSGLPQLNALHISGNSLLTLEKDIFYPEDFPESDGHPSSLELSLRYNSIDCDRRMCWIKEGEQDGWLSWYINNRGKVYKPDCVNNPNSRWYFGKQEDYSFDSGLSDLWSDVLESDADDYIMIYGWDDDDLIQCSNTSKLTNIRLSMPYLASVYNVISLLN